jgi:SAM-dependent methyltransferase
MTSPASPTSTSRHEFDEEYYRSHLGAEPYSRENAGLVSFFSTVADHLIRSLQPRTVLDAGCAMGLLVEAFWDRGITAWGSDISSYAIGNVRRDIQPYCKVASLSEPIEGTYDLITCIEVLEHMPEPDALAAIVNLSKATDTILFSSSFTDLEEPTHVNVRQPIWWLEEFSKVGFSPDLMYDASFVSPQAMLLRKQTEPVPWDVLRLYSELLRYKYAVSARDAQLNAQAEQMKALETSSAAAATETADRLARLETRNVENEQRITELSQQLTQDRDRLRKIEKIDADSFQRIEQLYRELSEANKPVKDVQHEFQDLKKSIVWLLRETETAAAVRESYSNQLAQHAEALRGEISPVRPALLRNTERLDRVEAAVAGAVAQVRDIVNSRIWQTLVKVGGVFIRVSGR